MSEERDVSEFNGSQLKMFRIDEIIKGINMCRHQLDLTHWLSYLHDFDMELESVKKREEKERLDKQLKALAESINRFQQFRGNPRQRNKPIPAEIIDQLNSFQKELLTIFKQSGLELRLAGDVMSGFGK